MLKFTILYHLKILYPNCGSLSTSLVSISLPPTPRHLSKQLPQGKGNFRNQLPGSAAARMLSPMGHPIAHIIIFNASSERNRMDLVEGADGWSCGQEGNTC